MTYPPSYPLVDAHAHLTDPRLSSQARQVLERAQQEGVTGIVVNATGPEDWQQVLDVCQHPLCLPALGLHPFCLNQWNEQVIPVLRTLLQAPNSPIVAIGEIGLDAWDGRDTMPLQLDVLAAQLQLAQEFSLPVCLHIRKAWNDFFSLLKSLKINHLPGLCHHFTGSPEVLKQVLKLGLMVSFCGPATNPGARKIHQAIQLAPLDTILTETDCPNLPIPQTGCTLSLPHHTRYVLETISALKNIPIPQLARQIQDNFQRLFQPRLATQQPSPNIVIQ